MEFADGKCPECGAEFGDKKPAKVTRLEEPYETPFGRFVELVGPCPSCGKNIPLWAGISGDVPDIKPGATKTIRGRSELEEPEPEPKPEPEA